MGTGTGSLTLVATPVGNLGDLSPRAVAALAEADLVLAEDTRTTGKLLRHAGIDRPLRAFHLHNEHRITEDLVNQMAAGARFALCSDAGTPGISDPGFLLVRASVAAGVTVSCLPGPTAFVPALAASGLPCDRFVFEGFLPRGNCRGTGHCEPHSSIFTRGRRAIWRLVRGECCRVCVRPGALACPATCAVPRTTLVECRRV